MQSRQINCLFDILRSVELIKNYLTDYTKEEFLKDTKIQDAVLRRLLIAGQAAIQIKPETCTQFPKISFDRMTGMRNCIIDGKIDCEIIWETTQRNLPIILLELKKFFNNNPLLPDPS